MIEESMIHSSLVGEELLTSRIKIELTSGIENGVGVRNRAQCRLRTQEKIYEGLGIL